MKIRLTNTIFYDVTIMMVGIGVFIGIAFPFFIVSMGLPSKFIMNDRFFLFCILAGIFVAIMNIIIMKLIILKKVHILSENMKEVESIIKKRCIDKDFVWEVNSFLLEENSKDTMGECNRSFNNLIISLFHALKLESDLHSFATMLSKHLELDVLSSKALHLLMESLSSDGGVFLNEKNGELFVSCNVGIKTTASISKNELIAQVIKYRQTLFIEANENICLEGIGFPEIPKNVIIHPIVYKDTTLGVIILSRTKIFSIEEITKLDILCMSLSIALENATAHHQLQQLAATDPLTGVYNRRFGKIRLNEEYSRAVREGAPLGVIMFDIDHFKVINDSFGHIIGDKALNHVANLLKETFREGDVIVRYGGEEFLCILPGADQNISYRIAERARSKIMKSNLKIDNFIIPITISGGVAAYPSTHEKNSEHLMEAADIALYEAKNLGRNRIVSKGN